MIEPFELEWLGGAAEHHFRKARPGIEEFPWGTLDTSRYPQEVVDAARASWTESAYTEYRAVAAFSEVLHALCEAKAPLDLIGLASSFLADEVLHVELASRMAMELGGGVPRGVDFEALVVRPERSLTPFQRANELVMRISSIAEAYSGRLVVSAMRTTTHPLTRAVYERIVADESLHHRLGSLYFDWAAERMDDSERLRLADIALRTLRALVPSRNASRPSGRAHATAEQIHAIGWIESRVFLGHVRAAVSEGIVAPLASYGIVLAEDDVEALLAR